MDKKYLYANACIYANTREYEEQFQSASKYVFRYVGLPFSLSLPSQPNDSYL